MSQLRAEVISIGDEMTSGARLDTNAQWLSRRLGELGIEVAFHTTVGDSLEDNVGVFRTAIGRADVVVSTGGLGPTRDDLTREALAEAANVPLEFRPQTFRHIEAIFAHRKRAMPERNRVQAMFPAGSCEIFNPQGTAPGIELTVAGRGSAASHLFALPGVPAEMKRMFDESVEPRILELRGGARCIRHAVMKFFGTGESDMEQRLGELIARGRQPRIGITVSAATISLRITATADTETECERQIAAAREQILAAVGELYFGDGEGFEQHHAVERELIRRGESLVVIELGYAAPLGDWFAALGQTLAYRGGLSLADRADLLRLADRNSLDAAIDWARQRFQADWVLLVDRYPELDGETERAIPAAEISLVVFPPGGAALPRLVTLGGHPSILHARIGKAALQWLREQFAVGGGEKVSGTFNAKHPEGRSG